jgi:ribulose-5-phosphate 4-epimerase/fuculose-1-phosphate aldolase
MAAIPNDPVTSLKYQVAACTRIFNEEGILDFSGHVSARLPDGGGFVVQSVHASRAELEPDDLYAMTLDGGIIDGPKDTRPVSEYHIHSEIYRARPDVNAVLHAHPEVPILFTVAKGATLVMVKNHSYRWRGGVPIHRDTAHVNTAALGRSLAGTLGNHNALLIRAHGVVIVAEDVPTLLIDGVHFDENARAVLEASRLGPPDPMTDEEFDVFEERFDRAKHGVKLWHYYTRRGFKTGLLPEAWTGAL